MTKRKTEGRYSAWGASLPSLNAAVSRAQTAVSQGHVNRVDIREAPHDRVVASVYREDRCTITVVHK